MGFARRPVMRNWGCSKEGSYGKYYLLPGEPSKWHSTMRTVVYHVLEPHKCEFGAMEFIALKSISVLKDWP